MEEQEKKPMAVPQYPPVYYYPEDEITLKELILKFQEYLREFRRNLDISTAQLTLLNILEAPSVKITQPTVTPDIIGSSLSKIIVISSILAVFLALGWVVVRKIIKDALS